MGADRHILTPRNGLWDLDTRERRSVSFPLVEVSLLLAKGSGALLLKVAWTLDINRKTAQSLLASVAREPITWGTLLEHRPPQQPLTLLFLYF